MINTHRNYKYIKVLPLFSDLKKTIHCTFSIPRLPSNYKMRLRVASRHFKYLNIALRRSYMHTWPVAIVRQMTSQGFRRKKNKNRTFPTTV